MNVPYTPPGSAARYRATLLALLCLIGGPEARAAQLPVQTPASSAPNILLILVDDLGYTDLGSYGSDISTPHIDALAAGGTLFTNAHAYPSCAPSRAALITGRDPHRVGFGAQSGFAPPGVAPSTPGYSGVLEGEFTSIARLVNNAGYRTYQVGKWHLGHAPSQRPKALGFDHNFSLLDGAASHYADMRTVSTAFTGSGTAHYDRNNRRVDRLPGDFYSTTHYTRALIDMLEHDAGAERPFFAYLAYTAVHDPLHAPAALVEKYRQQYGDDVSGLRQRRIAALADRGLLTVSPEPATREIPAAAPPSDRLKRDLARRQAVYAAMLEHLDAEIGRLVAYLKDTGVYENTVIFLLSDNGASGAPRSLYTRTPAQRAWQQQAYPLREATAYGQAGSFPTLGAPNAQASSGPFLAFKATLFEGGTRVPMIAAGPGVARGARVDTFVHIADLYTTIAALAQAKLEEPQQLAGRSLRPVLDGSSATLGRPGFGAAFMGWRAYREGPWKLVFMSPAFGGTGDYALYNLDDDPGETRDLSAQHPQRLRRLAQKWDAYATANGVIKVPMDQVNRFFEQLAGPMLAVDRPPAQ